jgi:hypothetical protein
MSEQLAARYRRFAQAEADGRSPLYATFARGVADDADALGFLAALPPGKQQPNLLFAALRHVCGTPRDWPDFRDRLRTHAAAIRATMQERGTQTNEPGRCATLLPILAGLPQPLALIEVGASAGLCLLPDRYGYEFGARRLPAPSPEAPSLPCHCVGPVPLPMMLPQIVWRRGLDLCPIDLADASQSGWLETLVWPEQTERLSRLRAAIAIARRDPPLIVKGDLLQDLPALAREAPKNATLVVFHSAALAYVAGPARQRFVDAVQALPVVWISNEAPAVFPLLHNLAIPPAPPGAFLLSVNARPTAWTGAHGEWIEWIGGQDGR